MGLRGAAVLALALLPALCVCMSIRGLQPALAARYKPTVDGKFACLDGKKSVPFQQVNDDYCDCLDGSDEPGTSACPNGHFYCENKFFLPLLLNSSMVDDSTCDCCDGSDEPAGRCINDCYTKGYESLIALKDQAAAADKGVQARIKYIEQAVGSKQKWADRKSEVEVEMEHRRKEAEVAEAEKSKLEEEQRKLRERKRELEDGKKERQGLEEPAQLEGEQQEAGAAGEGEEAAGVGMGEVQAGEDGVEAGDEVEEKYEEELAKERMAQWIPGAKDGNVGGTEDTAAEEADVLPSFDGEDLHKADAARLEEQQNFPDQDAADTDAGADDTPGSGGGGGKPASAMGSAEGAGASVAGDAGQRPNTAFGKARLLLTKALKAIFPNNNNSGDTTSAGDEELSAAIAALDAKLDALNKKLHPACTRATDARQKVTELEQEQRKLQDRLGGTYGEGDAYAALVDRCFEAKVDKYAYEVCPFDKASQKEGSSITSLGTWSGFEDGEGKMAFRNGQGCWQGPSRSMTVSLRCGQQERLARVEEPSRCEYTAELETPAACTPVAAEALRREVEARQRFLDGGDEGQDQVAQGPQPFKDEL